MKKKKRGKFHSWNGFLFPSIEYFVSLVLQWNKIPARILICCFLHLLLYKQKVVSATRCGHVALVARS